METGDAPTRARVRLNAQFQRKPQPGDSRSCTSSYLRTIVPVPLANGVVGQFCKKLEKHPAMVALYFMYYNFGRVHQTLRVTLAMEAGLSDHVWSVEEIVGLLG